MRLAKAPRQALSLIYTGTQCMQDRQSEKRPVSLGRTSPKNCLRGNCRNCTRPVQRDLDFADGARTDLKIACVNDILTEVCPYAMSHGKNYVAE